MSSSGGGDPSQQPPTQATAPMPAAPAPVPAADNGTGPPWKVQLAVYDLSQGMARQLGPALLGMEVEAIYHTGIVVYGKEHFFGGGIVSVPHEEFLATYHMQPFQMLDLGETEVEEELFNDFLQEISGQFNANTYNLMSNNCNNCSNAMAEFLVGQGIPQHILELPQRVFSSPMGMLLRPMFEQMQGGITQAAVPGFHFDSFEGGQEHHINQAPPLIPQAALNSLQLQQPTPFAPAPTTPSIPAVNPWANLGATSTSTPAPALSQQPPLKQPAPAPVPAVLAANDKPLLSLDPLPALKQTVATCLGKLRALAVVEASGEGVGEGGGSSLLSTEDDRCLEEAQASLLDPSKPLPPALPALLSRALGKPWPPKAEFFALSLLRPLLLRPAFPTPELVALLVSRVAAPESFASKASLVVALSALANAGAHKAGRALLLAPDTAAAATDAAVAALRDARPEVRQMAGAFLANLALGLAGAAEEKADSEELPDVVVQLLCGTLEGAGEDADATSAFRRLLCAGRLVKAHGAMAAGLVGSLGFDEVARSAGRRHGGQVQGLAAEIGALVQQAAA